MKKQILGTLFFLSVFCLGTAFGQNEKKLAYGILLDNTGSLRNQFSNVTNTGKAVVREIGKKGSIALFNFETVAGKNTAEVKVGVSWSQDEKAIYNYIDKLAVVPGQTTLFDAIFSVSNVINSKVERENSNFSKKILILVTDGEERSSDTKQKNLIKVLRENKIKVYAIGLIKGLSEEGGIINTSPRNKAKDFLSKIAKETGGRVIFPKSKQTIEEIVKELFVENIK